MGRNIRRNVSPVLTQTAMDTWSLDVLDEPAEMWKKTGQPRGKSTQTQRGKWHSGSNPWSFYKRLITKFKDKDRALLVKTESFSLSGQKKEQGKRFQISVHFSLNLSTLLSHFVLLHSPTFLILWCVLSRVIKVITSTVCLDSINPITYVCVHVWVRDREIQRRERWRETQKVEGRQLSDLIVQDNSTCSKWLHRAISLILMYIADRNEKLHSIIKFHFKLSTQDCVSYTYIVSIYNNRLDYPVLIEPLLLVYWLKNSFKPIVSLTFVHYT